MPENEPLEERLKKPEEREQVHYHIAEVLGKNTDRPLTPYEITNFLKKREEFYFNLKKQGKKTPVQELEDAFGERAEHDEKLINILCEEHFSRIESDDSYLKSIRTIKRLKKELCTYREILSLYDNEGVLHVSRSRFEGFNEGTDYLNSQLKSRRNRLNYRLRMMLAPFGVSAFLSVLFEKIGFTEHVLPECIVGEAGQLLSALLYGGATGIISYIAGNQELEKAGREKFSPTVGIASVLLGLAGGFTGVYGLTSLLK